MTIQIVVSLITLIAITSRTTALTYRGSDGSINRFRIRKHAVYVEQDGDILQQCNVSFGRCLRACALRSSCNLINYRRYFAQCRLYSNVEGLPTDVNSVAAQRLTYRKEKNSVVLRRDEINELEPLPDDCQNCNVHQECDLQAGRCITTACPFPVEVEHARVAGNIRTIGARLDVTCDAGYKLSNENDRQVTCLPDGQWSTIPNCIPQFYDCPDVPEVINADMVIGDVGATYTCLYHESCAPYRESCAPFTATCSSSTRSWMGVDTCIDKEVCDCYLVPGIPDSSLTASMSYDTYHRPIYARLGTMDSRDGSGHRTAGSWSAYGQNPWIQAKFDSMKHVTGVVTSGRGSTVHYQYVKTYYVTYSQDCAQFSYVRDEQGNQQVFVGNTDQTTLVRNVFEKSIDALCVRLHPLEFQTHPSLRFDVIGCDVCETYLVPGIPDSSLTSSSSYDERHSAVNARLGTMDTVGTLVWSGGWAADSSDANPWIQARFGALKHVTGIVTAGRGEQYGQYVHVQYVKSYTVKYSHDCNVFDDVCDQLGNTKVFTGNTDITKLVTNIFPEPVDALCIRLYPIEYENFRSLRFDVIGCADCIMVNLVSDIYGVADSSLTASSVFVDDHGKSADAFRARLDSGETDFHYGGWAVPDSDLNSDLTQQLDKSCVGHFIQLWDNREPNNPTFKGRVGLVLCYLITDRVNTGKHRQSSDGNSESTASLRKVEFRRHQRVSGVVTQGMEKQTSWVTSYHVTFSADCVTFTSVIDESGNVKVFTANTDATSKVENDLPVVVRARCVRIEPVQYVNHCALRFDINGCVEYVCPSSPGRFITPSVRSSLALRVMPGEYSHQDATNACESHGKLVILRTANLRDTVISMINNCLIFAGHSYWVDGRFDVNTGVITFSDGTTLTFLSTDQLTDPSSLCDVQDPLRVSDACSLCVAIEHVQDEGTGKLKAYSCTKPICEKNPEVGSP